VDEYAASVWGSVGAAAVGKRKEMEILACFFFGVLNFDDYLE